MKNEDRIGVGQINGRYVTITITLSLSASGDPSGTITSPERESTTIVQ